MGACFKLESGEFITAICGDQLYRALGTRKTMKQLIKKIILYSSLHFASAIISISKCCPLGEALDQLGACQKVQADHFLEEVALLMPSSDRVEAKLVEARCKEVAEEFMARVDGVLIDTRKDTLGSLILEIWDEGYQQVNISISIL